MKLRETGGDDPTNSTFNVCETDNGAVISHTLIIHFPAKVTIICCKAL